MKLKSMVLGVCLGLVGAAYATGISVYPKSEAAAHVLATKADKAMYCPPIEIVNNSRDDLYVSGVNNDANVNFTIYAYEGSMLIEMFYDSYGNRPYCHDGMFLTLRNYYGIILSRYVASGESLYVRNGLTNAVQVEARK